MRLEDEIKQKSFSSEKDKAIINLIYTFNRVDYQSKNFFKQYGLTPQQYNILRILRGQHPEPCTINLLKERMLDKMCDASRMVERLRLKQLLKRKTCTNDRRSVDIIITQKGLDLLASIDPEVTQFNAQLMSGLNDNETKILNTLLDKMRTK
ncbi:MAG: MarR family winged helix-turn-helix transcriptional regulator [Cytophagaceae bacterium]